MYGTGNSNLNAGRSPIANLVINKTTPTDIVTLTATTIVNNALPYTNGILTTDPIVNPAFCISPAATPILLLLLAKKLLEV